MLPKAIEASSSYFYGIWLLFATYCYLNILFATNHGLGRSVKVYTRIDFLRLLKSEITSYTDYKWQQLLPYLSGMAIEFT